MDDRAKLIQQCEKFIFEHQGNSYISEQQKGMARDMTDMMIARDKERDARMLKPETVKVIRYKYDPECPSCMGKGFYTDYEGAMVREVNCHCGTEDNTQTLTNSKEDGKG